MISPELLPTDVKGEPTQSTESSIGPYELHDFFLFHFLRYAAAPEKILYLAGQAKFDQGLHAGRDPRLAAAVPDAVLRPAVQALVPAGRAEGRLGEPVAARRLAHAQRRGRGAVVEAPGVSAV